MMAPRADEQTASFTNTKMTDRQALEAQRRDFYSFLQTQRHSSEAQRWTRVRQHQYGRALEVNWCVQLSVTSEQQTTHSPFPFIRGGGKRSLQEMSDEVHSPLKRAKTGTSCSLLRRPLPLLPEPEVRDLFVVDPADRVACFPAAGAPPPVLPLQALALGRFYVVKRKRLTPDQEERFLRGLARGLIFQPKRGLFERKDPEKIVQWRATRDAFFLPRFWGLTHVGAPAPENVDPQWNTLPPLSHPMALDFWAHIPQQRMAVANVLRGFHPELGGGAILVCGCGFGKTFTALRLAHETGQRTVILVSRGMIQEQWVECILRAFPTMKRSDVGCVGGSPKYQKVTPEELWDKQFLVCVVQKFTHRDFVLTEAWRELFHTRFGMLVVDECHHMPATLYREFVREINYFPYTVGLSAEPDEFAGNREEMMYHLMGPVAYHYHPSTPLIPTTVLALETSIDIPYLTRRSPVEKRVVRDAVKMKTAVSQSKAFNRLLVDLITRTRLQQVPGVVFLDKPSHANHLQKMLERENPELSVGQVHSQAGNHAKCRKTLEKCDLILITVKKGGEAICLDKFLWTVVACELKNPRQLVGRTVRVPPEGSPKRGVLVLDPILQDEKGVYKYQSRERMRVFASCGYAYETRSVGEDEEERRGVWERVDALVGAVCLGE